MVSFGINYVLRGELSNHMFDQAKSHLRLRQQWCVFVLFTNICTLRKCL